MSQSTEIHTLAGAFALDALTEFERASFARHLTECESCAAEVAELTETAARLAAPAWETPPARLRDAVLAEVSQTRQLGRVPAALGRGRGDARRQGLMQWKGPPRRRPIETATPCPPPTTKSRRSTSSARSASSTS